MRQKDDHLKKIVTGVIIYYITFVSITWITFWIKGSIPDTLIQFGLGGGVAELFCTALIQVFKKKYDIPDGEESSDDVEYTDFNERNQNYG